jgi:hypothetical protein
LNRRDFIELRERNRQLLAAGRAPGGIEPCCECGVPLQESKTGCHRCGDGKHVCSRCYYQALGRELDEHPIGAARLLRRG